MEARRTQAERREESRRRLIDAAIELLSEHGYAGATMAEIAGTAGLSRGLVTHHFGSKESCMRAVVDAIREGTARRLADSGGGLRGLTAIDSLLDGYFSGVTASSRNARAMYVVMIEALTSSPGLRDTVAASNEIIRSAIAGWIGEAVEDGSVPAGVDARTNAVLIEGILRGVVLQWLADPEQVDLPAANEAARRMVRAQLGAVPAV